jgi:DNA-directed RNA polymerase subunit RPC12/RpoP
MKIAEALTDRSRETESKLEGFANALERGEVDAEDAVRAVLREDAEWFNRVGDKFGVEPPLILFMFETPLKPFFEDLSRKVEEHFIEKWWEPFCPVCGRQSALARIRGRKRYIVCTYCGTQYLVDLFKCINCGNNDPESQGFIGFENYREYELNYCEKCGHYIKAIVEDKQDMGIPQGLEDLLTRELDAFAKDRNLGYNRQ